MPVHCVLRKDDGQNVCSDFLCRAWLGPVSNALVVVMTAGAFVGVTHETVDDRAEKIHLEGERDVFGCECVNSERIGLTTD